MGRVVILSLACFIILYCGDACGRSAFSPRHTGMDPPGGPRSMQEGGRPVARTPMGGMGYTDAYGNAIDDVRPEEKKVKRRRAEPKDTPPPRPLPDPQGDNPVWSFN